MKRSRRQFLADAGKLGAAVTLFGVAGCESFLIDGPDDDTLSLITPDSEWFFHSGQGLTARQSPVIAQKDWEMELQSGGTPITTVKYDELEELARSGSAVSVLSTMRCIKGTYVGARERVLVATGVFKGVPLREVLEGKQISGEATKLRIYSEDGFTSSISWDRVFDDDALPVLLAYELNGRSLSVERGGPVRLLVPEMWGFKSVKWVNRIDARTDFSTFGTYETGEYAGQSAVDNPGLPALTSFVFEPDASNPVQGPDVQIVAGAMVGGSRIASVRVTLDGGTPQVIEAPSLEAVLESSGQRGLLIRESTQFAQEQEWPYPGIMVPFRIALRGLAAGPHTVSVAAISTEGAITPDSASDPTVAGPSATLRFEVQ